MDGWTYDFPSNYAHNRMLVLDFWDEEGRKRIFYSFYRKEVTSPFTILAKSAVSEKIKEDNIVLGSFPDPKE